MILRNVAIRHSRMALAAPMPKSLLRTLTTETLAEERSSIEHSIANHTKETHSIEANLNQLQLTKSFHPPRETAESKAGVRRDYALRKHIKQRTSHLGSKIAPHYEPSDVLTDPPRPEDVTLELLMASQAHFGHSTSLWNPMNQRYIYGVRAGIHIISLEVTAAHLRRAAKVVEGVAYHGGLILFVGTRKGQDKAVVRAAKMAQGCHLFERWIPGTITNGDQILSNCAMRVVDAKDEPLRGFEQKIGEWKALRPDLVVVLNPRENYVLLHECGLNNIPTIGVIDTDADPTWVTYPIPANDDSLRCIQVIAGVLGRAGEAGQKRRLEDAEKGVVTWLPPPGLGKPKDMEEADKREKEEKEERDGVVGKARSLEDESEELDSRIRKGRVDPEDEEKDDF